MEADGGPQELATDVQNQAQVGQEQGGPQVVGQQSPPGSRFGGPAGQSQPHQGDTGQAGQQQGLAHRWLAQQEQDDQPGIDEQPETREDLEQPSKSQDFALQAKAFSSQSPG